MINLSCFCTDQTSYGLVSLYLLREMIEDGAQPALFPEGQVSIQEKHLSNQLAMAIKKSFCFNVNDISLRINHQWDMAPSIGRGLRCGLTFFELNQFTNREFNSLASLDKIFVSSHWAKNVCEQYGLQDKTYVTPLGVDRNIFYPVNYVPNSCVFLSIGKWEVRKDQDGIVSAFNKAFELSDNVELWLLFESGHVDRSFYMSKVKEYKETKLGSKIKIIPRLSTLSDVARIMQQSFCFVSNSKAEAWNMEVLEAMSCGKQCISPMYSGEGEYINNKNCLITSHNPELKEAKDGKWFGMHNGVNEGYWCEPNYDQLIQNMRETNKVYCSHPNIVNTEGIKTANEFSWHNTYLKLKEHLCLKTKKGKKI